MAQGRRALITSRPTKWSPAKLPRAPCTIFHRERAASQVPIGTFSAGDVSVTSKWAITGQPVTRADGGLKDCWRRVTTPPTAATAASPRPAGRAGGRKASIW